MDWEDRSDFEDARRGFITSIEGGLISSGDRQHWDMRPFSFLDNETAPHTVNPSLWRMARLNSEHGLFKVCEGIYQVRGYDLANITFVETTTGVVVIDPLTFEEAASASLALYAAHRGLRKIHAVIYSHSHRDHYGGAGGIISLEDANTGKVLVIAPNGFMEEVVAETALAGVPMRRRAQYQFGSTLAPGPRSHVDSGLGKQMGRGRSRLIPPNRLISETGESLVIDGLEIVFQLTPGTEAPAEMNFFFPGLRALNMAENACHTMHNLCPIRGAKTRDALAWSKYIDEAINLYASSVDVVFAQHHWPVWGWSRIVEFLEDQRDLYRFLHDQTLRLMSHGMTPLEIAEKLLLPVGLSTKWHNRGYYGAVVHNVNAIYAHYLGPYDGNPARLNRLPPEQFGAKLIAYAGGIEAVVEKARSDFDRGEFRWVAEVMNHAVFADPLHQAARELCAAALEQLGYQAESATWRNSYLLGAKELRVGLGSGAIAQAGMSGDIAGVLPMEQFFDILAIHVDGIAAAGLNLRLDWTVTDEGTIHRLTLRNGALHHRKASRTRGADAQINVTRPVLVKAMEEGTTLRNLMDAHQITVTGDLELVREFFDTLELFPTYFNIIEP